MNKLLKAGLLLFLACIGTVQAQQKQDTIVVAVSYTHLTLPTILRV